MRLENTIIVIGIKAVIDYPALILFGAFMLALMVGFGALFGVAVAPVGFILVYGVYGVLELIFALITHPFTESRKITNNVVIQPREENKWWNNVNGAGLTPAPPKSNLPKNYDFDKLLED